MLSKGLQLAQQGTASPFPFNGQLYQESHAVNIHFADGILTEFLFLSFSYFLSMPLLANSDILLLCCSGLFTLISENPSSLINERFSGF